MDKRESREDYLECILILKETNIKVRSIDIAAYLNFSKASVSIATKKLVEDKTIVIDENGYIDLTCQGKEIASRVYERHILLAKMFMGLGVSKEIAFKDACKIEHDISDETFNAIKKHIEKNI